MKLLLLLCLTLTAPLSAQWERRAFQVVGSSLLAADAYTTIREQRLGIRETNVLLGQRPSTAKVVLYMGAATITYNYAIRHLPRPASRLLGLAMLGVESYCIVTNARMIRRTEAPQ